MKESILILKMVMKKFHTKDKKREQLEKVVLKMLWKKTADLKNIHSGLSMKLKMKRVLDKNSMLNTMQGQGQESGVEKKQLEVGMTDCYNHFQRKTVPDKTGEQVVCILDSDWNKKRSHHLHHCFRKRLVVIELVAWNMLVDETEVLKKQLLQRLDQNQDRIQRKWEHLMLHLSKILRDNIFDDT